MSLSYSNKVRAVVPQFKAYRNSIDVYTEDKASDSTFYRKLFARILDGTGIRIEDVYPLGDCDNVRRQCKAASLNYNQWKRPRLYMIDGDIYLMYSPKTQLPHMYILDTYCIENKLICEDALASAISCILATIEPDDVKKIIQFNGMFTPLVLPIMSLYYHMVLSKEQIGVFRLHNIEYFYDFSKNKLKCSEIQSYIKDVKSNVASSTGMNSVELDSKIEDIRMRIQPTLTNFLKYVSGKDYLLPFAIKSAVSKLKRNNHLSLQLPKDSWKHHLAVFCDLSMFQDLKDAILNEYNLFQSSHQQP